VFYGILLAGIILGTVLSLVSSNPIQLLVLSAVVNGIAAGPFLIVIMLISRDQKIMGAHKNGPLANTMGWIVTVVMCVAGIYGIWYTLSGQ
jgi:Mn2+/Fe2+ NRAMP family transporter